MSTYISSNSNGEMSFSSDKEFIKQDFQYKEAQSYRSILTDTTPVFKAQDVAQKQTIDCLIGKINSVLQQEVRSDECKLHADTGETHYVPDVKLKDIWKQVDEKYGKRADAVRKKLLKAAGKDLAQEGYTFECEPSNTDQPDKWKLVRDVKNPNVGKSYLDRWLEEGYEEDKTKKEVEEPEISEKPEEEGADIVLPDSVQIPRPIKPDGNDGQPLGE